MLDNQSNSSNLLVSVLMTSYNREKYIEEAILAVINNTYKYFELIIVDDASTDNTVQIANKYAEIDSRVKLFVNDQNLGQFKNRNKAASLASGVYIMHADSDDTFTCNAIEKCVEMMLLYPDAGFGMYYDCDDDYSKVVLDELEAIRCHFFIKPFLMHGPGATIIKNAIFQKIGGFPIKYGVTGDMYYNLNAASHTPIVLLRFKFLNYRIHDGQEINDRFNYLWANFRYLMDAIEELPFSLSKNEKKWIVNKNRRRFIVNITTYLIKSRDFSKTIKAIKLSQFSFVDFLSGIFH